MRSLSLTRTAPVLAALACLAFAPAAHAQFLGTQVTGALLVSGGPPNYFSPAQGYVPNGYLNKTQGATVTVAEPAIEFGYGDGGNTDSINITNSTITLTDVSVSNSINITYTLTDAAFAGLTFNQLSNTFPGGGFSLTGNTLTLSAPAIGSPGTYTTVLSLVPAAVPEPGSIALLATSAMTGAGFLVRRRKQARKVA